MEKLPNRLPHETYRDKLAKNLNTIRDAGPESEDPKSKITRAEAKGYLGAKKESGEYKKRKKIHSEERQIDIHLKENNEKREDFIAKIKSEHEKMKEDSLVGHIFKKITLRLPEPYHGEFGSFDINQRDIDLEISQNPYYGIAIGAEGSPEDLLDLMKNKNIIPEIFQGILYLTSYFTKKEIDCAEEGLHVGFDSPPILEKGKRYAFVYSESINTWKIQEWGGNGYISSVRFKEELQPLENVIEKVGKLRGVSFKWKSDGTSPREIGVIAEEVAEVFPELVFLDREGKPLGVHYDKFVAVLIEAVKDLDKRLKDLENK
jgi:hypothetical protein